MSHNQISSPMELHTAIRSTDRHSREKLWRQAEGKWLGKVHLFGLFLSYAMAGVGFAGLLVGRGDTAAAFAVAGATLVVTFVFQFQQRQIDALREIVRESSET